MADNIRAFLTEAQRKQLNSFKNTLPPGVTNRQVAKMVFPDMFSAAASKKAAPPPAAKAAAPPPAAKAAAPPASGKEAAAAPPVDPMAEFIIVPNEAVGNPDTPLAPFVPDPASVVEWTAAIGDALTHWTQFDPWVRATYAREFPGEAIGEDDIFEAVANPLDRLRKVREGGAANIEEWNTEMAQGKWQTVNTYGEGTCQTHAMLFGLSQTYRRIPHANRGRIAQLLRTQVFVPFFRDEVDRDEEIPSQRMGYISNIGKFLEEWHLNEIRRKYGFNLMLVVYGNRTVRFSQFITDFLEQPLNRRDPIIFIFNRLPFHFSAIYLKKQHRFILSLEEFFTHYPRLTRQLKNDYLKGIIFYSNLLNTRGNNARRAATRRIIEVAPTFGELEGRIHDLAVSLGVGDANVQAEYNRARGVEGNIRGLFDLFSQTVNASRLRKATREIEPNKKFIFMREAPFYTEAVEIHPNRDAVVNDMTPAQVTFANLDGRIEGYEQQLGLAAGSLRAPYNEIAALEDPFAIQRRAREAQTRYIRIPRAILDGWRGRRAAAAAAGPPPAANGVVTLEQAEANELKKIRDQIMSNPSVADNLKEQVIELKFEAWQNKRDTRKKDAIAKAAKDKFNGDPKESIRASSAAYALLLHNEKDKIPDELRKIAREQGISENFYLDIWNKTYGGGGKHKTYRARRKSSRSKKRATRHKRR